MSKDWSQSNRKNNKTVVEQHKDDVFALRKLFELFRPLNQQRKFIPTFEGTLSATEKLPIINIMPR